MPSFFVLYTYINNCTHTVFLNVLQYVRQRSDVGVFNKLRRPLISCRALTSQDAATHSNYISDIYDGHGIDTPVCIIFFSFVDDC